MMGGIVLVRWALGFLEIPVMLGILEILGFLDFLWILGILGILRILLHSSCIITAWFFAFVSVYCLCSDVKSTPIFSLVSFGRHTS